MSKPTKPTDLLVAESPAMIAVREQIDEAAVSDEPVIIEGEPGTGRELVARIIHTASARRLSNLETIKGARITSEAFSTKGSGSPSAFQRAEGGSLLIRDLGSLSKPSQKRLWHLLETAANGTTVAGDIRLIATTDPELRRAVDAGVFSAELYGAFRKRCIVVPPLRERAADIPPLASNLIRGYARTMGRTRLRISTRAYERMVAYAWPGNVAELKSLCRRLVLRSDSGKVEAADVDAVLPTLCERVPLEKASFEDMVRAKLNEFLKQMDGYPIDGLYEQVLARVERPLLATIMEHTGNNQVKAAEILGLNRNTLRRKLAERGVRPQPRRASRNMAAANKKRARK